MMKRVCALILVLALACSAAMVGSAADETGLVEYNGSTLNVTGTTMGGFDEMIPGIPSEGTIELYNSGNKLTQFYMSTEVVDNLLEQETSGYVVRMWVEDKDGNVLTTILGDESTGEQVGGSISDSQSNANAGLEDLENVLAGGGATTFADDSTAGADNYLLVATLSNSERAYVKMSITPDGSATVNNYMNANTAIEFDFYVQEIDPITRTETKVVKGEDVVVTQTRYWLNGVQTGDPVAIAPLVAVLALAVLVFLIAAKKKKKKEE